MHRRNFFSAAGLAAIGPTLGAAHASNSARSKHVNSSKRLKVLMLGGTGFLGPSIVKEFLDQGHEVTLFNRGVTNPHLFTFLERLKGNREEDGGGPNLDALKGRDWDVVVDTWQKGPKCVEDTARLLSGHAGAYFYISTISVYHNTAFRQKGAVETARLSDLEGHPIDRRPEGVVYYLRKTLGEKVLQDNFDGNIGLFRSHGMRGDRKVVTDEEKYWPVKIWRGGKVLTPGDGQSWAQITDVVSLCRFLVHCAENNLSGAYNVMARPFRLIEYLNAIKNVTKSDVEFVWASQEKLAEFDVEPYRDLPMWRLKPEGIYHFNPEKAFKAGFVNRTLEATAASMLEGYFQRNPNDDYVFGTRKKGGTLAADREAEILRALGH